MTPTPNITAIIRTYTDERWEDFVCAVESLQCQTLQPAEIVIVVDHNLELLLRVKKRFPQAVVVENYQAKGSPGAWNSGIAAARGEILAFTDDDAVAEESWLEQLAQGYEKENVIGVGGPILPFFIEKRPAWLPEEFDWVLGCTYKGLPESPRPVRNLIGANMSFRRQVFEKTGGFREGMGRVGGDDQVLAGFKQAKAKKGHYFHGCDETELCIRIRQAWPDKILLYQPGAKVHHRVYPKRASWSYFRSRCYLEGTSKALLSQLLGADDALDSERSYTFKTLPRGVAHGLREAVFHGKPAGALRAGAICAGLAITAAGYLRGTISLIFNVNSG